jgi:hypothetical protein
MEICRRCDKPREVNPITQELTCFTHGRPDGSAKEKKIWDRGSIFEPVVPTRDEAGYK